MKVNVWVQPAPGLDLWFEEELDDHDPLRRKSCVRSFRTSCFSTCVQTCNEHSPGSNSGWSSRVLHIMLSPFRSCLSVKAWTFPIWYRGPWFHQLVTGRSLQRGACRMMRTAPSSIPNQPSQNSSSSVQRVLTQLSTQRSSAPRHQRQH